MTDGLDEAQLADIDKMLGSPLALPSQFTTWVVEWLVGELSPAVLQLGGASQLRPSRTTSPRAAAPSSTSPP